MVRGLQYLLTSTRIHHTAIADDEAVLIAGGRQVKECIFDLDHCLEEVLLELDGVVMGEVRKLNTTTGEGEKKDNGRSPNG